MVNTQSVLQEREEREPIKGREERERKRKMKENGYQNPYILLS